MGASNTRSKKQPANVEPDLLQSKRDRFDGVLSSPANHDAGRCTKQQEEFGQVVQGAPSHSASGSSPDLRSQVSNDIMEELDTKELDTKSNAWEFPGAVAQQESVFPAWTRTASAVRTRNEKSDSSHLVPLKTVRRGLIAEQIELMRSVRGFERRKAEREPVHDQALAVGLAGRANLLRHLLSASAPNIHGNSRRKTLPMSSVISSSCGSIGMETSTEASKQPTFQACAVRGADIAGNMCLTDCSLLVSRVPHMNPSALALTAKRSDPRAIDAAVLSAAQHASVPHDESPVSSSTPSRDDQQMPSAGALEPDSKAELKAELKAKLQKPFKNVKFDTPEEFFGQTQIRPSTRRRSSNHLSQSHAKNNQGGHLTQGRSEPLFQLPALAMISRAQEALELQERRNSGRAIAAVRRTSQLPPVPVQDFLNVSKKSTMSNSLGQNSASLPWLDSGIHPLSASSLESQRKKSASSVCSSSASSGDHSTKEARPQPKLCSILASSCMLSRGAAPIPRQIKPSRLGLLPKAPEAVENAQGA